VIEPRGAIKEPPVRRCKHNELELEPLIQVLHALPSYHEINVPDRCDPGRSAFIPTPSTLSIVLSMESGRCVWCGRPAEKAVAQPPETGEAYILACSALCARKASEFLLYRMKYWRGLLIGFVSVIVAGGALVLLDWPRLLPADFAAFGILIVAFPFATGETVSSFGLRRSILFLRTIGLAAFVAGILLLLR